MLKKLMELTFEFNTSVQTFAFIFFAGFLTSLTPCIFPMIPITLSLLGTQSMGQTKLRGFLISLFYVHGIATTYSVLGLIAAQSGILFGSYLSNPWLMGTLSILFIILGLSFYGLFEIQVPSFLRKKLGTKIFKQNFLGAYLSGLVAGIVASPCVGPVLIALLAHVAKTQNTVLGFFYLFTYAMGLGLIFIILGTFSQLTNKLPKSGPWLSTVKFIFGSSLILMSAYYLKPILSYNNWLIYLGSLFVLISGVHGVFSANKAQQKWQKIKKTSLVLIFVLGCGFIFKGFLNPQEIQKTTLLNWQPYSKELIESAKNSKFVMIDFYADWCEACHTLEKQTFTHPQVKPILDTFLLLKLDATTQDEAISQILAEYDVTGLPYIVFIDQSGKIREDLTLTGFENASLFLKRLQKLTE